VVDLSQSNSVSRRLLASTTEHIQTPRDNANVKTSEGEIERTTNKETMIIVVKNNNQ